MRLSSLFVAGGVLIAGQSERAAAGRCADYYATVHGDPAAFVHAIIEVESAWQPHAISNKGAAGLMQLMPATAATFGVTNRFEVEQNIRGRVAYLAYLRQIFNRDLRLVSAAYVAGEHNIRPGGLNYKYGKVFEYVSKVVRLYRQDRLKRMQGGSSP